MERPMGSPMNEASEDELRDRTDSESSLENDSESRGDVKKLSTTLDSIGYGFFHIILLIVAGWALASDSVEVLCISFISPAAQDDLNLTRKTEGWLDASIFIGMMIGGYFWGGWADAVGRRTCLLNSLLLNGGSGFVSAFMPNYGWFLTCRIFSGIGVGGSMPVIFSYFTEFFSKKKRGPYIIMLSMFWTVGQVYTAVLAWLVIPQGCIKFHLFGIEFHNWRVFAMLCTIPSLSSVLFIFFLPESPSYLLHAGKQRRLSKALSTISRVNKIFRGRQKVVHPSLEISNTEKLSFNKGSCSTFFDTTKTKLKQILKTTVKLFNKEFFRRTVVLIAVMFTLSFGYYGLQLWFPEYFKNLIEDNHNGTNESDSNECTNTDTRAYRDSLFEASASIPGNFLGLFVINMIGGKLLLTSSMLLSGVSVFFIWWVKATEEMVVILGCLFNAISIAGWNALNVLNAQSYPTELRSTAMGFQAAIGRIAAIAGINTFGAFYKAKSPTKPILIVAVCLFTGGFSALFLPAVSKADQRNIVTRCVNRARNALFRSKRPYRSNYSKI